MFQYFFAKARRFSEGAPQYGFLGPGTTDVYPLFGGYGQARQFHVTPLDGASPLYDHKIANPVTPAMVGRFHSWASPKTSPLVSGGLYGIDQPGYADAYES